MQKVRQEWHESIAGGFEAALQTEVIKKSDKSEKMSLRRGFVYAIIYLSNWTKKGLTAMTTANMLKQACNQGIGLHFGKIQAQPAHGIFVGGMRLFVLP